MANPIWNIDGNQVQSSEGASITWDDHKYFTLTYSGQEFNGEIMDENVESNSLAIKINHRVFHVKKQGPLDGLIAELGLDTPKVRKLKELEAPMPGRIVNIAVEIGQELNVGDEILSLEAMKMENVLKAEGIGKVKAVNIANDQVVEKGAILIEFE